MKLVLIQLLIKIVFTGVALGIGIWYLSSSIGGASLTYSSMENFFNAISTQEGDVASVNGCFLCKYLGDLFQVLDSATKLFWNAIVENLWIVMAVGFGFYLLIHTIKYIYTNAQKTATLDAKEKNLSFKDWFDPILSLAMRILFVGGIIGLTSLASEEALTIVANVIISPVLFFGSQLAMAASGILDVASCGALDFSSTNVMSSILQPFMCIIGNINAITLAGAAGGFALMNYAWLGMGGGLFTWISGLGLVIAFLIIGFNLFFEILTVIFKLIFIIIFLPFLLAAMAYEKTWTLADKLMNNSIKTLVNSAVKVIVITLKTTILLATVSFAADEFFPGPADGYSAILPPMLATQAENKDSQTLSVANVFSTCEKVALADGEMDKEKFVNCFNARKAEVERTYPGAFDFMRNGWNFMLFMIGLFVLYFWIIKPKVDGLLASEGKESFDFGKWTKDFGKTLWSAPQKWLGAVFKGKK